VAVVLYHSKRHASDDVSLLLMRASMR
jgi:hypothetical protein